MAGESLPPGRPRMTLISALCPVASPPPTETEQRMYLLGPSAGIPMSPRCADKSPWYSREEGRERRRDLLPWRVCKNVNDLPMCFKESTGFRRRLFSHPPPACQYESNGGS
ncbi:hypothetical protein E2C01_079107 [Portunus trituberculatus]|uniref:Uncharacterized protein n=1 Tax=Portunus trituberculatus TaxID=210409 RepID=A0A5B7IQK0_PORTR|nr:hypothetical protein [Portunus trituberculatus]